MWLYYITVFIIGWLSILTYIEFTKDEWHYYDMEERDEFVVVHFCAICVSLILPYIWPLVLLGILLTYISKFIKIKVESFKEKRKFKSEA